MAGLGEALRCAGHAVDQLSVLVGKGVEQSQLLFEDVMVDWHRAVVAAKAALQKRLEVRFVSGVGMSWWRVFFQLMLVVG